MSDFKAYSNHVIFKTDVIFNDKATFKGVNGQDIVIQPGFDPARHVRCYGEVVSIPLHLSKHPVSQELRGSPPYSESSPFEYRHICDIEQEVKVSDRVYYHFNTITMKNCVKIEGTHTNRVWYYKVSYDQIICAVRDGQIIPIASYVLCDPDMESWEDIFVPTKSGLKDKHGKDILKPKDQWIQKKVKPEHKFLTAFVRHVGKPLKGDNLEFEVGQKIWYRRNADWMNKIEGRDYFVIRQRHITGKEVDGKFVPIRGHMLIVPEPEPEQTESGIYLKKKLTRKGIVYHGGDSDYPEGMQVLFGENDRQEIVLNKEKYLLIRKRDVFATHERTVKP